MHCDICAENVQPKLPRQAIPRQVLDFNEHVGLDIFEFASLERCNEISEMFECRVSWNSVWSETTALDVRRAYREGWQRWARDPKQVVLDPAGEILHDILFGSFGAELC